MITPEVRVFFHNGQSNTLPADTAEVHDDGHLEVLLGDALVAYFAPDGWAGVLPPPSPELIRAMEDAQAPAGTVSHAPGDFPHFV